MTSMISIMLAVDDVSLKMGKMWIGAYAASILYLSQTRAIKEYIVLIC